MASEVRSGVIGRPRPALRGVLHLCAVVAASVGLVVMLLLAHDARGYVGASVFGTSLIAVYLTSASYHLPPWRPLMADLMRRLDHAMIFFLIVGTYTPFCLTVIDRTWGITLLSVTAAIGGVGAVMRLLWLNAPRWLAVSLYLVTGWTALFAGSQILGELAFGPLALLVLGGVAYSAGAIVYALKRPDPWPRVFGYHEVFHSFTIAGSVSHYIAVSVFVLPS